MLIGGLQKFSLIDYPGKIGATVFTQGCNFRCGYCHNPELVDPRRYGPVLPEKEVLAFLEQRRQRLEAVIVSGGEPTLQRDLERFLRDVKEMGYLIKLDTNGSQPDVLERLLQASLLDYVAMDLKAPLNRYAALVSAPVEPDRIARSIELILAADVDHEFRTTVTRSQLSPEEILSMAQLIKHARLYVLQAFVARKTLNDSFLSETAYPPEELFALRPDLEKSVQHVMFR